MQEMFWIVYIKRALSGTTKYNFKGDKQRLMTFIGCYVSTEIEQTNIRYESVPEPISHLQFIEYTITREGEIRIWFHD